MAQTAVERKTLTRLSLLCERGLVRQEYAIPIYRLSVFVQFYLSKLRCSLSGEGESPETWAKE